MSPSRRRLVLPSSLLVVLLAAASARSATPGEACRDAATEAEQAAGLPAGLLLAIGRQESGLWPWAINAGGRSISARTTEEAVAAVRAETTPYIDVGCFQIDLAYHPGAFATLEEAFNPAANAAYAARFLTELKQRFGSWDAAVAAYHSQTPGLGAPYREAVLARWHGTVAPAVIRIAFGVRIQIPGEAAVNARGLPRVVTPRVSRPGL